jgi:hypothetical protein
MGCVQGASRQLLRRICGAEQVSSLDMQILRAVGQACRSRDSTWP